MNAFQSVSISVDVGAIELLNNNRMTDELNKMIKQFAPPSLCSAFCIITSNLDEGTCNSQELKA